MPQIIYLTLFSFIAGMGYAMGFPSVLIPTQMLTPLLAVSYLLWVFLSRPKLSHQLISLAFFSLGHFTFGFYWIPYTIHEFGQIPFPINYLLGIIFSLMLLPYFYLFIALLKIGPKLAAKIKYRPTAIERSFLMGLALTALEYFTPQQFPAHLGHTWMHLAPYLGPAAYVGAPFYSFISFTFCSSFALMFVKKEQKEFSFLKLNSLHIPVILLLLFLGLNLLWKISLPQDEKNINARFVQGNIGNFLKVSAEAGSLDAFATIFKTYKDLSAKEASFPLDLIIWPETAYPYVLQSMSMIKNPRSIPKLFHSIVSQSKTSLLTGGYDFAHFDLEGQAFQSEYNTAFLFDKSELFDEAEFQTSYHKRRLIPFGEGLPFGDTINAFIDRHFSAISFFAAGKEDILFRLKKKQANFITLICYEVLFSQDVRQYLNNISEPLHFFVNLTNDSWYGKTSEPFQHLFLSKWRAVEFQLPFLRATNTGITSVIYNNGLEGPRLGLGQKSFLDVKVPIWQKPQPTLFQRFGIGITVFLAFLFWAISLIFRKWPSNLEN